ncbi:MAG: hypothetical protein COT45_04685 [bacterium (Candidatus Stahlbacteria) CG08_land_8_20_14_0_20_40_26]|nr:MAG: hypothetical protein COT45_04685 [bacterium (Candidatus Stahlbacteria) CG08_land_8_20_14_0_20_40_26]
MPIIGFDASMIPYQKRRGWGVYSFELLRALVSINSDNKYVCVYNFLHKGKRELMFRPKGHRNIILKHIPLPGRILEKLWLKYNWPDIDLFTGHTDIFHSPFERLPPKKKGASIVTIHDVIYLMCPDKVSKDFANLSKAKLEKVIERADIIIADSNSTAKDLNELYKISSRKLRIIWCGVADYMRPAPLSHVNAIRTSIGIGDIPYFLFVGAPDARKNLENLIGAMAVLKEKSLDFRLIIAGHFKWGMERIQHFVSDKRLYQYVIFPGYIPDEDLPALYTGAQALCLISFYEGFGLPVAEAAKCGCPSIVSNRSSLPEVVGDGGIVVPPDNIDAIVDALMQLLDQSTREKLSAKALKQGSLFSWKKCAKEVIHVYEELT